MKGVGSKIPFRIYLGGIIFCLVLSISITTHQVYADSLIGAGINLKINGNSASGTLTLKGQHYKAPNLNIVIKKDQITLTGNIIGSYQGLLMTTGIHTKGIEYKFNGVVSQNGKNTPTTFTVLLTNDANKPTPTITPIKQPVTTTVVKQPPGLPMLMLTTHNGQVYMAYTYNFVVKIFDPKSNPQKIFDQFFGGISDVNIIATILDPNNKIIGQSIGKTDSKGIYQDGIGIPYTQYSQEQVQVMINATKKGYTTQISTLPLLLIHPNSGSAVCSITTSSLPGGVHGTAYSQQLSSNSCPSPSWSATGLPGTLSISASGLISGTLPAAGTYNFVVTVTASGGRTATTNFSIIVT